MIVVSSTSIIKIDFKQTVKISDHYKGTLNLKQIESAFEKNLKQIWKKLKATLMQIWN